MLMAMELEGATSEPAAAEPAPEVHPERGRATGPPHEGTAIGIAIGLVSAFGYAGLAFLLGFTFFAFVAIYALVKAIGDQGSGSPIVVIVGTVVLVTTFVTLLCLGLGMLGKSLTPKKRRRD